MYRYVSDIGKLILIDFLKGLKLTYYNSFTILSLIERNVYFFLSAAALMKLYNLFNKIQLTE